jgi:hypothetical protein
MERIRTAMAFTAVMAMLVGLAPDADAASARVRCEKRPARSKISVDGRGLASGLYTARVESDGKRAVSGPEAAVGDEVEFDFDSKRADIAEGATQIGAGFVGAKVRGEIVNAQGVVVASSTVSCRGR